MSQNQWIIAYNALGKTTDGNASDKALNNELLTSISKYVVHSSAHDKRRHKRIDRLLKQDPKQLEQDCYANIYMAADLYPCSYRGRAL